MADGQAVVAVDAGHRAHSVVSTLISTKTRETVKHWAHQSLLGRLHKIFVTQRRTVNTALGGPAGWLLILLSVAVLTVAFERIRFWTLWWKRRHSRSNRWNELLRQGGPDPLHWMEERDGEMRFAQSFLEASTVLAPLIGLIGTVLGLSHLLSTMGPQLVLPADGTLSAFGDVLIPTAYGLVVSLVAMLTLQLNNGLRQWQKSIWRRDMHRQPTS